MFEISKMSSVLKSYYLYWIWAIDGLCAMYSFLNQLFIKLYAVGAVLSPGDTVMNTSE